MSGYFSSCAIQAALGRVQDPTAQLRKLGVPSTSTGGGCPRERLAQVVIKAHQAVCIAPHLGGLSGFASPEISARLMLLTDPATDPTGDRTILQDEAARHFRQHSGLPVSETDALRIVAGVCRMVLPD